MNKLTSFRFILFCTALALLGQSVRCSENEEDPTFPRLLDPERLDRLSIHIVTESISETDGRETIEEYADFIEGKNTFIKAGAAGHSVKHLDAGRNIIFHYKPYECFSMTLDELSASGLDGFWKATSYFSVGKQVRTMHLFGVAALWLNAGNMPKKYTSSSIIYSASRDVYNSAMRWTIEDKESEQELHFFFIAGKKDAEGKSETRLEMIKFQSTKTNQVTRTLNILEIRYKIDSFVRENLLQVPVGYGCIDETVVENSKIKYHDLSDFRLDDLLNNANRIDLEVTYTNYGFDSLTQPVSQTVNVQLARHPATDTSGLGFVQLIRQRDTSHDFKTVTHHQLNVQYNIDYRRGTCNLSHVADETNVNERLSVKFSDEVEFDEDLFDLHKLFGNDGPDGKSGFHFVKRVETSGDTVKEYYETTLDRNNSRKIRFVRVYGQDDERGQLNLDSVTAYLFNEKLDHILSSYQFNLIEVTPLANVIEIARLFDVSEECYLNNQEMQVNRDYAWFQIEYPLEPRFIAKLSPRRQEVKATVYDTLYHSNRLTFFRVPKMELIFTETGMTVRALLIDLPKIHILFRNNPRTRLSLVAKPEIEIDVDHCSEFCRLNRCMVMSYCEQTHICSVTDDTSKLEIVTVPEIDGCTSYVAGPLYYKNRMDELGLHAVVSNLQHQDYNTVSLPKIPEELLYLDSDTELDPATRANMTLEYLSILEKFISETGTLPSMTFSMTIKGLLIILLPNRFLLEEDPMEGFHLSTKDTDQYADSVQPFHEGLPMRKFVNSILSPQTPSQYRVNLFRGLNYDQCAMACSDSRCSSFSYCQDNQECLITDIYNLTRANEEKLLIEDARCFISQRDFLSRFNKFADIPQRLQPDSLTELDTHNKLIKNPLNPSECAHSCVVDRDLDCLAFDFCRKDAETLCIFYNDRQVHFNSSSQAYPLASTVPPPTSSQTRTAIQDTQCDHYTRSYLADFIRIEYRRLKEEELTKVKTSSMEGVSVYQCADECVNHLADCTAFQFCLLPKQSLSSSGSLQSCVFIESRPATEAGELSVLLNETDGLVLEAGRLFELDANCQVFSLRKDSTEAQVRELALAEVDTSRPDSGSLAAAHSGAHFFSYVLLYVGLTLVFTTLNCAFLLLGQRSEYLRPRIERIQALFNM